MAYEPTNWKSGDTVTSAKLNKMEQGIAGGANILLVGATMDLVEGTTTLDKTWQEIFDADIAFVVSAGENAKGVEIVYEIRPDSDTYELMAGTNTYVAQSANDYPVNEGGR